MPVIPGLAGTGSRQAQTDLNEGCFIRQPSSFMGYRIMKD